MRNAIQPRLPFVVGADQVPRRVLRVGSFEHFVSGTRVFIPPAEGFQVHGAQFPLAQRILEPCFEPAMLFFLADLQPIFDEKDARIHDVLFDRRTQLQERFILLVCTKSHNALNAGAVIPASVENHDFAGGRKMSHIALHVHLRFFAVRGSWQGHEPKYARADALRNRANRAAFAGSVASLEDNHDPQPFVFDPILQFAQFGLQPPQLLLILLPLQALFFTCCFVFGHCRTTPRLWLGSSPIHYWSVTLEESRCGLLREVGSLYQPTLVRNNFSANEAERHKSPRSPASGRLLPVFGSFAGAAAAGAASAAGAAATGAATTTRIGTSAGGAGGGGGIVPVTWLCCDTTTSGVSTILVALMIMPFLRPNASTVWPFTLNFWSLGILNV